MGHQRAASLLLAGDRKTASELESAGLVTKVLPRENFLEGVLGTCYRIAKQPSEVLKLNKSLMMQTSRQGLLEANETEMKSLKERARSQEARSAVDAFLLDQELKRQKKAQAKL